MFLSLWGDSVKSDPDLFQWPFLKRKVAASDCQDTFSVGLKPKITRTPGFHFRFFFAGVWGRGGKVRLMSNSTLYFLSDHFFSSLGPFLSLTVISLPTSFPHSSFEKSPWKIKF